MRSFILLGIGVLIASLIISCWSSNTEVYTGPPPRATPLDSIVAEADKWEMVPLPDSLTAEFRVPGDRPCSVKVEFRDVGTRLVRTIIDTVYSPGEYSITWDKKDSVGVPIKEGRYYYQFHICGKSSTQSVRYFRQWQ